MNPINFDREKLNALKDAYVQARAKGLEQFDFEGNALVTGYAKYLIEYLDQRLENTHTKGNNNEKTNRNT